MIVISVLQSYNLSYVPAHTYSYITTFSLLNTVPTPSVSITAPMDILYAGTTTPLTLTCSVNIDPSLTSDVNVSLSWLRGASQLFNGTSRALISPLSESQSVFTSTLTVYPLSTVDSTNFTCRAGIIPQSDRFNSTAASDLGEETVLIIVQCEL